MFTIISEIVSSFSVQGDRPIADQMSGGDLDGDKFTVIWDKRFYLQSAHPPFVYNTSSESLPTYRPSIEHENIIPTTPNRQTNAKNKTNRMAGSQRLLKMTLLKLNHLSF